MSVHSSIFLLGHRQDHHEQTTIHREEHHVHVQRPLEDSHRGIQWKVTFQIGSHASVLGDDHRRHSSTWKLGLIVAGVAIAVAVAECCGYYYCPHLLAEVFLQVSHICHLRRCRLK